MNHTPTPWEIGPVIDGEENYNECANVRGIVIRGPRKAIACQDDAAFIVTSVNSHEALLGEVKEFKGKARKWMDEATHQATERDSNFAELEAKKDEVRELEKQVAGLMSGMNLNLYREKQKSLQNINEELIDILKQVKRHADGYNIDGKYRIHRPTIESETAKNWNMLIRLIEKVLNNE